MVAGTLNTLTFTTAPMVAVIWWWFRSHDPQAVVMMFIGAFIEIFLIGGLIWLVLHRTRGISWRTAGGHLTVSRTGGE